MIVTKSNGIRQWLKSSIEAASATLAEVPLVSSGPISSDAFGNRIEIGRCTRRVEPLGFVGGMGPGALRERLLFEVTISAYGAEDSLDFDALETAATDMLSVVETVVRTDPTANGLAFDGRPSSSTTANDYDSDGYAVSIITAILQFEAQI